MTDKRESKYARLKAIRWTVELAASEFPINPRTLSKRIKSQSLDPGPDGKWSTGQICSAVFGDYESHRSRKMAADADMAERESLKQQGRLLDADDVMRAWESIVAPAKNRLQTIPSKVGSRLSLSPVHQAVVAQEIDEALAELAKVPDYSAPVIETIE